MDKEQQITGDKNCALLQRVKKKGGLERLIVG